MSFAAAALPVLKQQQQQQQQHRQQQIQNISTEQIVLLNYDKNMDDQKQQVPPQPEDPVNETFTPLIEVGIRKPTVSVVPYGSTVIEQRKADVIKGHNPQRAYFRIPSKPKKSLNHHAPGWGDVYIGYALPRINDNNNSNETDYNTIIFQEPATEKDVEYVAIKRLRKNVVDMALQSGKRENPYKEIDRMQQLGDNRHVLTCIEALYDDTYLYIIMPYCEQQSLVECIPWNNPERQQQQQQAQEQQQQQQQQQAGAGGNFINNMQQMVGGGFNEDTSRSIYKQVLENMQYLHINNICHRDLSPDNCMIYNGRVVLTDLAMSFKLSHPTPFILNASNRGFGKTAYLPPETVMGLPYDPYLCDLWSSIIILFNLVTGEILYNIPHPNDIQFRYFILAQGLSSTTHYTQNERAMEILQDLQQSNETISLNKLFHLIQKCLSLSPSLLELFENILKMTVSERWTLPDVSQNGWIRQG